MSEQFTNMKYVWNLLPEHIWKRYEILDVVETREQLMLADASKELLKVWKQSRPRLFGKDRPRDNDILDNTGFDSCRP